MKTFVRFGAMVVGLGLAGLFAGCSSYSSHADRGQPARDFEVVETSTKRQLTGTEMAYLRAKVRDYLAQQGQTGSGDYYVKVYLGEESGVAEGEWVIVRFTRYPSAIYSVAPTGPTYSYPSYGYSSYDYYPFGFLGLSAFSFRYYDYDYPYYYGTPGYYPRYYSPVWTGGRWHDRDRWRDRRQDDHKDRDRDRPRVGNGRPSGALKPSFVPANVGRAPGGGSPGGSFDDRRRRDNRWDNRIDRSGDSSGAQRWSERPERNSTNQRPAYTPPSSRTGAPTVPPAYRPATRSNLYRDRSDAGYSRGGGDDATPRGQQRSTERSYSPPARSESSSQPRYESSRYEASGSSSGRSESSGYTKDRTDGGRGGRRTGLEP